MPTRRPFGSILRRRRKGQRPDGTPHEGFHPGFYVRIRLHGREVTRYGGPDRRTALDFLERLRREQDRLALLSEHPERRTRFEDFAKDYLAFSERAHTPATAYARRRLVAGILVPHFQGRLLSEITSVDVEMFLNGRRAKASNATCNRSLTALSSMFKRAIALGLLRKNPVDEVHRGRETQTPLPLVDTAEQQRLIDAIPARMRPLFLLALETGLRLGELLRLSWADVDLPGSRLRLRHTKAKRPRIVGLTRAAKEALSGLLESRVRALHGPDLIFPTAGATRDTLRWSWRIAFKRAAASIGRPELRIHDLRHLAAINLVRAGLDLPTVQGVLGHTSLLSTLRYAAYSDDTGPMRAAAALDRVRSAREMPQQGT